MESLKQQVELSAIVSTRNRAKQLSTLIQCLGSQAGIENLKWEIVIVDNNSTDNTKEVAYAFCEGSNLKINYIHEPKIGLANARNTGILYSKGSYLLFVDDDVLIPNDFINNTLIAIHEYPEFHMYGFRILPYWEEMKLKNPKFKKPYWLNFKKPFNLIQSFIPIHDLGIETLQYPNRIAKNPIGACFLVKKEVFEKVGPFREDLGAGQSGVCEDTEFFWYAMINDYKILYWPYSVLYHPVLPDRLNPDYLHKWYFKLGKSLSLIKNSGRIYNKNKKPVLGFEGFIANKMPAFIKKIFLDTKIFKVSIFLWLKLFILVMLLPLSVFLLLIKKPFYITSLIAKTFGEIKESKNIKKSSF